MKEFGFQPEGVCCKAMKIKVEEDTILGVTFYGGCPGNATGLTKMLVNRKIQDVINELKGITCGNKPTSCPDQLAKALEEFIGEENGNN